MCNEPYHGSKFLQGLDDSLKKCRQKNNNVASYITDNFNSLNDLQRASMEIIPQGIHIGNSIRKLVKEAYLFGAFVLMRSLLERTACMSTLRKKPKKLKHWRNGWRYKGRPSLNQMIDIMTDETDSKKSQKMAQLYNHITHGDPIGASYNKTNQGAFIAGPHLRNPKLCDFICFQTSGLIHQLMIEMDEIFPIS